MTDETFDLLVANQKTLYDETGRIGARPSANLVGMREGRPCVSVSCRPCSLRDMIDKFVAATILIAEVEADEVALVVGDEWAEATLHHDELPLPADGCAAVVLAGRSPRGIVRPYRYDRNAGKICWGTPVALGLSLKSSLWAEVLVPQCLPDPVACRPPGDLPGVAALNRRLDNQVLFLEKNLMWAAAPGRLN